MLFTPVPTNPIDGTDLLERRTACPGHRGARPAAGPGAVRVRHRRGLLHRGPRARPYRARALVNFGANLVMAHGDSARVRDALAVAGLLRPRRHLPQPDRRPGRHRAAGGEPVRDRGVAGRFRGQPAGAVPRPAPSARAVAPRGEARSDLRSSSPSPSASGSVSTSGTATSRPPGATSSPRAASRSRRCARNPAGSPSTCPPCIASTSDRGFRHTDRSRRAVLAGPGRARAPGAAHVRRASRSVLGRDPTSPPSTRWC